jgi:hypothetical protein
MKTKVFIPVILILFVIILSSCFAGANPSESIPSEFGTTAGFWKGLWHGVIAPFTFIVSLFTDSIQMYEVHNNGGWYNFGFVLGASIIFGGPHRASKSRRK